MRRREKWERARVLLLGRNRGVVVASGTGALEAGSSSDIGEVVYGDGDEKRRREGEIGGGEGRRKGVMLGRRRRSSRTWIRLHIVVAAVWIDGS